MSMHADSDNTAATNERMTTVESVDVATQVILLSGGSGTRLWPLSNERRPKQFVKVLRDDEGTHESMVQRTVRLVRQQNPCAAVTIATSDAQVDLIDAQLTRPFELSIEPERRDTAPAIMLAAAHVAWEQGASEDAPVVVMPIDTFADPTYYANVNRLADAVSQKVADLVLLGVEPTMPTSRYGYIVPRESALSCADKGIRLVSRFVEKPASAAAAELIAQGALWNCGVFAFRLGWLLDLVATYSDARSYDALRARYAELPKNSFDYEVVERASSVAVIPYAGTWKDLGTWDVLCDELEDRLAGNVVVDDATTSGVHAINETDVPVVVAGVSDVVVVVTKGGVLVSSKDASPQLKDLLQRVGE